MADKILDKEVKQLDAVWHVSQHDDGWKVIRQGGVKAIKTFATQKEAIDYAKEIAKNNEGRYVIHGMNGKIRGGQNYASNKK
ncbi:DUF2188 domain-containing protein [Mycoplasma nasistruthionis]|uniref:DUF2188 domain-containing protein n=1 Tax=Mycoplasma nasistruthionis TaxID=353852 RepID=A0A4Y6I5Y9_9MOLU|nr:DUF2188 domain-containing protein [Mycoplasma nasistruthionis]QCZ36649.1 DUF2188 domain-containing protein [Mycoplasma nasistruthionis]QDF64943.1 DUF2188 domain-containing protein [Mycoplasma nasistruthionis]